MSNVLVLNWFPKGQPMRGSVWRHQHALDRGRDAVVYHNAVDPVPRWLRALPWDAVILHTVFLCARWADQFPLFRRRFEWIADLDCLKIAVPQDEYDHSDVLDSWLEELGVSRVLTCFGPEYRELLYPRMQARATFREVLTGYIDRAEALEHAPRIEPLSRRPYDIVYRALRLPYWFGSHGALKHGIAAIVEERAAGHGLVTNISTRWEDTIYDGWLDFLGSGRSVIGAESGSSVLDRSGEIRAQIGELLAGQPDLTFAEVDARLPPGWDAYTFFAISPRHLEAVVTKTCQVLIEGRYGGVLEPERHYIPLAPDFSNLDEVLDRLHDYDAMAAMADRAYEEVFMSGAHDLDRYAELLREGLPRRRVQLPARTVQRLDELAAGIRAGRASAAALSSPARARVRTAARKRLKRVRKSARRRARKAISPSTATRRLLRRGARWRR